MPRIILLLLSTLLLGPIYAQKLTGSWVGYFTLSSSNGGKTYPYEIYITETNNQQIIAKTITTFPNQTTVIASAKGTYSIKTGLLNITETKFDQIKIDPSVQSCLMNNFLSYQKMNGQEILQGTYMAKNTIGGNDCGTGSVYLTKDQVFVTENKKKISKQSIASNAKKSVDIKSLQKDNALKQNKNDKALASNTNSSTNVNSAKDSILVERKNSDNSLSSIQTKPNEVAKPPMVKAVSTMEHQFIPWVLISRENYLVKKIITHSKTISFDVFDNGTIDNDTISIYNNKKLLIDVSRLSYKPVHFEITFDDTVRSHEIIVVANNLGSVPPNTASIIYKDGKLNEEVIINTDFFKNAKLIVEYQPPK